MKSLDYIAPNSAEAAVALLSENGESACPLAGGTDLVVDLKHAPGDIELLVDVSRIDEFRGIEETEDGLRIGSMVTYGEIMSNPICLEKTPAIVDASHTIGAVQTRNLGTIGGNLVTCVPSADSAPALMVLDAEVTVAGLDGKRRMPIEDFFVGPRKTSLEPYELLVDIWIPKKNLGKPSDFYKFGLRKGQALALVNAAAAIDIKKGKIIDPRIALGAVAPTPIRALKAEALLANEKPTPELIVEASEIAVTECKPIDDFRASLKYRQQLVRTLTRRVLTRSVEIASNR
ncbi:MAG: FAD binding domain-containing protein [Gammaproteobacteria bacterium]|nr:FAD binding domain-containing protein [Gammaproteobacteria bacterium]